MITITKEVESNIIKYFKDNFKDLPKTGFLAGQSVASLVYKFLNLPLPVVINDVDVFQIADTKTTREILNPCKERNVDPNIGEEYTNYTGKEYHCNKTGRGYKVYRSTYLKENPLINIIKIESYNNKGYITDKIHHELMLNSFDFNCCSAGFDLETEKFYFTKSFLKFLNDLTLRVQSTHTPFHTLIRLNKKNNALKGVKCNKQDEQKLLINRIIKDSLSGEYIVTGMKFWESFEEEKNELNYWFDFSDYYTENQRIYRTLSLNKNALQKFNLTESFNSTKLKIDHEFKSQLNDTQFVHYYHLNANTDVFNEDYKNKVKNFISQKNPIYAAIYFKFISKESLIEFDLLKLKNIDSIIQIFNKNRNLASQISNYENLEDFEKMAYKLQKIYDESTNLVELALSSDLFDVDEILSFYNKSDEDIENLIIDRYHRKNNYEFPIINQDIKEFYLPHINLTYLNSDDAIFSFYKNNEKENKITHITSIEQILKEYNNGNISLNSILIVFEKNYIFDVFLVNKNNKNYMILINENKGEENCEGAFCNEDYYTLINDKSYSKTNLENKTNSETLFIYNLLEHVSKTGRYSLEGLLFAKRHIELLKKLEKERLQKLNKQNITCVENVPF